MAELTKEERKSKLIATIVASVLGLILVASTLTIWLVYENWSVLFPSKGMFYDKSVEKLKEKNLTEALDLVNLSIKDKENKAASYSLRADILEQLGKHDEAAKDLTYLAQVSPESSLDFHHRAYNLIQDDGSPAEIIRLESMAIAINPKHPNFYINRSYGYSELKQYQKARADCTTGLALKSSDLNAVMRDLLTNKADAEYGLKDYKACLKDCDEALAIKTLSADDKQMVLLNKAPALIGIKDYTNALKVCDEALQLVKDDEDTQLQFMELKLQTLEGRKDKKSNDAQAAARLKEECKRLKAQIEINDANTDTTTDTSADKPEADAAEVEHDGNKEVEDKQE
ncbi:MAG: hypothetical protein IPJ49_31120 [Candidatus Obscuribacter sp.]|nr:hypothetical protein [Candidatus Obscuribacter sp.]